MTVREIITLLSKFPEDKDVVILDDWGEENHIDKVCESDESDNIRIISY